MQDSQIIVRLNTGFDAHIHNILQTNIQCIIPETYLDHILLPQKFHNDQGDPALSRQFAISWQFHDISLTVRSTPANVMC